MNRRPLGRVRVEARYPPVVDQAHDEALPLHPDDDVSDVAPSSHPPLQRRGLGERARLREDSQHLHVGTQRSPPGRPATSNIICRLGHRPLGADAGWGTSATVGPSSPSYRRVLATSTRALRQRNALWRRQTYGRTSSVRDAALQGTSRHDVRAAALASASTSNGKIILWETLQLAVTMLTAHWIGQKQIGSTLWHGVEDVWSTAVSRACRRSCLIPARGQS